MDKLDKEILNELSEPAKRVFLSLDFRSQHCMLIQAKEMAKIEKRKERQKKRVKDKSIPKKEKKNKKQEGVVFLRYPSVGATETAILLAVRAVGNSYIYNAACEPEITDLAVALNSMGAHITGAGTPIIHIKGVECLGGVQHELIPDRIECATYLLGFAITHGTGKVNEVIPEHNIALISLLHDIGVKLKCDSDSIEIDATCGNYNSLQADALPYPGMPTDVQPILSTLAVMCTGNSMIRDSVFIDRFQHIGEYQKMGILLLNHITKYM